MPEVKIIFKENTDPKYVTGVVEDLKSVALGQRFGYLERYPAPQRQAIRVAWKHVPPKTFANIKDNTLFEPFPVVHLSAKIKKGDVDEKVGNVWKKILSVISTKKGPVKEFEIK